MKRDLIKIFIDQIYSSPDMKDYGPKNNRGYNDIIVVTDNF